MVNPHDIAKEIRQTFRSRMDGVVAQNIREKGVNYHINWGVTMPHLRDIAADYDKNLHVALELWQDNVRESKIIALMLMPPEEMTPDIADLWVDSLATQEIAENAAMLLFQHLNYAPQLAYRLISQTDALKQILGYSILSRLFSQGEIPDARGLDELVDQIKASLSDGSIAVRHSAYNCFLKLDSSAKLADSPFWHTLCSGIK